MKIKNYCFLLFVILAVGRFSLYAAELQIIKVPKLEAGIVLDGRLDEPVWQQAAEFPFNDKLAETHSKYLAELPDGCAGTIRIWRDDSNLYLGFRIENPYLPLDLKAEKRPRDGGVYSDECIEVFFNLDRGSSRNIQLIANALGSRYDGDFDSSPVPGWNGDWEVACRVVRGAWYSEWRIPHSDLAMAETIRINCGRASYGPEGTSWHATWKTPGWFKPYYVIEWDDG